MQLLIKEAASYKPTCQFVFITILFQYALMQKDRCWDASLCKLRIWPGFFWKQISAQDFSPDCTIQACFYHERFVGFISTCICLTSHVPKLRYAKVTCLSLSSCPALFTAHAYRASLISSYGHHVVFHSQKLW